MRAFRMVRALLAVTLRDEHYGFGLGSEAVLRWLGLVDKLGIQREVDAVDLCRLEWPPAMSAMGH